MGRCISKAYSYNVETQNYITNVSPFISEDCFLKGQLGIIINKINENYNQAQIEYLANDKNSLVLSIYDRFKNKRIALRIVQEQANKTQLSNNQQDQIHSTLQPSENSLILHAYQYQNRNQQQHQRVANAKNDHFILKFQELAYEQYLQYLMQKCINGIADLKTLITNHHLYKKFIGDFGFSTQNTENLSLQLQKCINLEDLTLDLSYCQIGNLIGEVIKQSLYKSFNVKKLVMNLRGNQIEPIGLQDLLYGISKCNQLSQLHLNLGQNFIQEQGAFDLGNVLVRSTNLISLTIYAGKNQIQAKGAQYLINKVTQCKNLKHLALDLTCNQIYFGQEPKLNLERVECANLTYFELDLSGNQDYQDRNNTLQLEKSFTKFTNLRVARIHFEYNHQDKARCIRLIKKAKRLVCIN